MSIGSKFGVVRISLFSLFYLGINHSSLAATDCTSPAQTQIPQTQCESLVGLCNATNGASWSDSPANNWNVTNTPCSWTGVTCSGGEVREVNRSGKSLVGSVPSSIVSLSALTILNLSNNQLSGSLPSLPSSLQWVYFNQNLLTGSIPSLHNGLTVVYLSGNQFSGSIPSLPSGSTTISLSGNQLTGTIPVLPSTLQYLSLSSNKLTGTIPTLPSGLTVLLLDNNQLSGTIPSLPAGLTLLELDNNALTGTLPSFASLTGLNSPNLNLGYNALTATYSGEDTLVSGKQATWKDTQTVPPTNIVATPTANSVQLSWTPITYSADAGYYQVKYATTHGGTYTNASSTTSNKSANSYTVTGLSPNTTYYFVVETFTPLHGLQQNNLTSTLSSEVSTTTLANTCLSTITVTSPADDSAVGTLRYAVANVCANGIIDFAPNLANQTITLTSKITFAQNITLQNPNAPGLNISGGNTTRHFHVNAGVTVTVDKLNIINGNAGTASGLGGAFVNYGTLNFTNGQCNNNTAPGGGGCVTNNSGATLNFIASQCKGNITSNNGGCINTGATLNFSYSTCDQNQAVTYGGCIYNAANLTIQSSLLSNNSVTAGGGGGAIFNTGAGLSNINDSTFQLNSATSSGGAISSNGGTVTVARSTFSQNSASHYGGAIRNDATFTISNSTFFNNTSSGSAAIHNYAGGGSGTINLINSTIANNSSYGVMNNTNGTLHLKNTLISNNSGGDCSNIGTLASNSRNLVKDNSCNPAFSGDPQLATTLALNGAPVDAPMTLALSPTSIAVNAGDSVVCSASPINSIDQREISRPQGMACDIGAFELTPPVAPSALQIQILSNTSLQLSWTDNSDNETGFKIERDGTLLFTTAANVVNYTDSTATCDKTYSYQVYAFNNVGNSSAVTATFAMPPCTTATAVYQSQPAPASTIDFGTAPLNTTIQKTLTLQEIGDAALVINSVKITGIDAAAFSFQPSATSFFIADGGAEYPLTLSCTPTQAIALTATLEITTNDPGATTVTYPLSCTGEINKFTLTINTTGSGVIEGCGNRCTQTHVKNTALNLIATPATGWRLSSWSGDCSNGQVVMNTNKTCTANFISLTSETATLTLNTNGSGEINGCGQSCTQIHIKNSAINLIATPYADAKFSHWSGDCVNGQVIMDANKTCTANFVATTVSNFSLKIKTIGQGSIAECGTICSQVHPANSIVNLVATPATGWQFSHWSDNCSNGQVVMTADQICTVYFTELPTNSDTVTLTLNITGSGTVNGCGQNCTQTYSKNSTVNLSATPYSGWQLSNWSSECSNGQVVMDANKTCTVNFAAITTPTDPIITSGIPIVPPSNGTADSNMSNHNQTTTDLTVGDQGSVSGGTIAGEVTNNGLIANVIIAPDTTVTGGKLSGFNTNYGTVRNIVLSPHAEIYGGSYAGEIHNQGVIFDPTILSDSTLRGGKVGGVVINQGVLQEVTFLPETLILGGTLSGNMVGDALGYVIIGEANLTQIRLSRACLTMTVKLDKNVVLDKTVIHHTQPTLAEAEVEDFCIQPESISRFTKQRIFGTEKLAFQAFYEENVAELPPHALEGLIAEQLANFRAEPLAALRVDQYQKIPLTAFKGLHKDNLGGFSPQVIHEFDAPHFNALQLKEFQQMPEFGIAKWLTNVNAAHLSPELIAKLLPDGWTFDEKTGNFTAPVDTQLAFKALEIKQLPENLILPPYQFDANTGLSIGGMGEGETLIQKINRTLRVQGLDYQAEQNQYGVILSKSPTDKRQFAFLLNSQKLLQRNQNQPIGAQLGANGEYHVTTVDKIKVNLLPTSKNPAMMLEVLGRSQAKLGEDGDVFLSFTQVSPRRVRDGEFIYMVTIFDPFVEPSFSDICSLNGAGESVCDWASAGVDMQPGIHFFDGARAKRQAKLIYQDGTSQRLYPTVFSPKTFIEEAKKFPGVESVTFNMDGTFEVMYQGQKLQLFPNFDVKVTPLEKYEHVKPSVKLKGNALEYQVQQGQQLLTSELSFSE